MCSLKLLAEGMDGRMDEWTAGVAVFLLYIVVIFVVPLGGLNNLGSDWFENRKDCLERMEVEE